MGGVDVQGLRSAGQSVVDLTIGNSAEAVARRRAFWRAAVINISLIGSWYLFSTIMSLYNSWLFSKKRYGFSYPLFVTSMHMLVQFALSSLLLSLCSSWVPRTRSGKRARPAARDWASKVVPCACATALDIGLSNLSLKTITLTFYTMCKSSNLAFVLIFAFLFRLEVVRLSLIGIITLITIGVVMMVAAETQFVLEGAIEVLTASAMGGLRWALTQILLDREGMGMNNPVATVFWLAPVMFVAMISVSAAVENWGEMFSSKFFEGLGNTVRTLALAIVPGAFAFCMNLSEFALIQRTSVVTLSVAGIFKEVSTIFISSTVFGDELTPINVTGLCIALVGIGLYNWLKYRLLVSGGASHEASSHGTRDAGYEAVPNPLRNGRIRSPLPDREEHEDEWADQNLAEDEESLAMSEREDGAALSEAELDRRRKREEEADMDGGGVWKTGQGFFEDSDEER
ncbi:TPT-domain-containing protein [Ceraceosorus guamensis]|uniref:TPT-domain-containing protein n=1 Tax=Ceraceosorus guamensis TaxID=1522189 RepID=A0A316W6K2_9BASI|nr:TPT-domain-containing protein [Ceraceosorus guamensis]PWN43683.1 TPT-domain-containing protein [Ceraceosorus guamensis]